MTHRSLWAARRFAGVLAVTLIVVHACERWVRYSGAGEVVEVEHADPHVTIRHADVAGLLGAATTRFSLRSAELLRGIAPGIRVHFVVRRTSSLPEVTEITSIDGASTGLHDHTPHHGGIVAMVGMNHLEARAEATGVYGCNGRCQLSID